MMNRLTILFCCLAVCLFCTLCPPQAKAYNISYSYLLGAALETDRNNRKPSPMTSMHQIVVTDGYCSFIYQGPFNRICFEAGPGFRIAPFAFDLHLQTTLHSIWLKPTIFGFFLNAGLFVTMTPLFQAGVKLSLGPHLFFVSPAIEVQFAIDEKGRGDARIFFQVALHIPTGSINFAIGNAGL
jgi:hypothetical protein